MIVCPSVGSSRNNVETNAALRCIVGEEVYGAKPLSSDSRRIRSQKPPQMIHICPPSPGDSSSGPEVDVRTWQGRVTVYVEMIYGASEAFLPTSKRRKPGYRPLPIDWTTVSLPEVDSQTVALVWNSRRHILPSR